MTLRRCCFALAAFMLLPVATSGQETLKSEIAPGKKLRVALIGVRVLGGVGEPVGRFLAERLGLRRPTKRASRHPTGTSRSAPGFSPRATRLT